jgi:hypothetical protein
MEEKLKIKTPEDWKSIYLQRFKDYHDNYSDEIPNEIINGENPENHKYKVRGNWFAAVKNSLENAALMKMLPEDFNEECRIFFREYGKRMLEGNEIVRTTKEEIDIVNNLLLKAQQIISNS